MRLKAFLEVGNAFFLFENLFFAQRNQQMIV